MAKLRHIVLFQFITVLDDESRRLTLEALRALRDIPGILEWRLEASMDERKGQVIVQNVLFESEEAFEAYRADPRHAEAGKALSAVSNWLVADYLE
ncbi:heme-degrading monooxygenase HmoA [Microbacteriaceae bacterium SG_E_30_P1]|uniref:Heme-degrading monooxygenase HmoA n=1 Tax=Antiquaquibacter oligotrophicus TaxID=2880260 RepID=A0ABT6KPE6_9MICO|nr:Dabb family protein [Antiquaquibacter oligotrophicus]MDH6181863.1 heme-degrading monooxygenase HmoA [Antiquaquibacter oligotrophicus]UDF12460.1 Dabb family protein [Antiquaquibacter oligotrophicus]